MISEPELVGEDGPGSSSDVVSGFDPEQGSGGGGRRRWHGALWGVAGALTASAVWAAAVFGYGVGGDGKPDARGYRVESDSCAAMELRELGRALGKPESEPATEQDGIEHPALHRIRCTVDFEELDLGERSDEDGSGWYMGYRASLTAELHKEADPRPVFEAGSTVTDIDGTAVDRVERVPDLGDSAYLLITDDNTMRLSVVEGGAVMALALSTWMSYNGEGGDGEEMPDAPEEPELLAYRGHLISDMRDVMKALRAG
ncbi:hypothetical protein [Streptomyces parvus]|uniref:hypothetical protein n=1 Tax=Streptomyces parvus TaxID=66428 RepID=UPI003639D6BC